MKKLLVVGGLLFCLHVFAQKEYVLYDTKGKDGEHRKNVQRSAAKIMGVFWRIS